MWRDCLGFAPWQPVAFIGVIFLGVLMIIVVSRLLPPRHRRDRGGNDAALDLLKQRFARGEIDRTEYEERRKILLER
jgi:putative membrane protein